MRRMTVVLQMSIAICFVLICTAFGQARKSNLPELSSSAVEKDATLRCFITTWLIEPDTTARIRFYNLRDFLNSSEQLVVESVNAQVLRADPETLVFRPSYSNGANNGYVALIARQENGEHVLGVIRFASEELPCDGPEDVQVHADRAIPFPEIYDYEANQSIGFAGFFTDGLTRDSVSMRVEYEQMNAVPDERRRLPKWVEAELRIQPGQPGSSIPPSALPRRPRNCQGFTDGRRTVDGEWVNIGLAIPVGATNCGSISGSGNTTYTRTLCGKAAAEFAASLGIKLPAPGQSIDAGGNVKIRGEINGCITITVTNTTSSTMTIICRTTRVNQIKIRDVFCCRDDQPYLCERWVCYRFADITVAEIPAIGIIFPGVESPSPETYTRVN